MVLKDNQLEVISGVSLTKTRNFIGTKKEYYCYYNFTITNEFIILERNPNSVFLKELPLLIQRNHNYIGLTEYKNLFKIESYQRNDNIITLILSNIKTTGYSIEIRFNQPEPKLEKWLTENL